MTKDLTKGNPMKLILAFTLPMLIGMLFQQMYNMVDTMIVGKLLGSKALAAVGSTGSISFLVLGFCMGVCSGFSILVAQQVGAKNNTLMRKYVSNAIFLSAILAVVMTIATCILTDYILRVMNTPSDIFNDSYNYIFVIFVGIPTVYLYNLSSGVICSMGDSKTPVYFLILSSILNIGLDFALILKFGLGVQGAAIATVISQGVSGLACLIYMYFKFPVLRMSEEKFKVDRILCKNLLSSGLPMGLQYSITAIGSIILQAAVNSLGSLYVAAVAAGTKLSQLLTCPYNAFGSVMATYCGQNVGANKLDRLGKGILDCSVLGLIYAMIAMFCMTLYAPDCAMWFIDSEEEEIAALIELVTKYTMITTAFFFPLAILNIVRFSIQGMGFSGLAMIAGVAEMIARFVTAEMLVPIYEFTAICLASPFAWICADIFLIPACIVCINHLRHPNMHAKRVNIHIPKIHFKHLHV